MSKMPGAIGVLNILEGLKRNNVTPEDLMISKVPVIPAAFRPYSLLGESFVPGDANELYRDLFDLKEAHKGAHEMFGPQGSGAERLQLYDGVKALYGYGDPVKPKTLSRGVSGFMKQVTGTSPKFSFVQRKLISKPQDSVARGVITIGAELGLDQIGIPADTAWPMYSPYVQRRLVQSGMSMADALKHVKERSPYAKHMLNLEMKTRPVRYSRAPSWHKFNVIAGHPTIVEGSNIRINPFVTSGMNADFDGDQINLHVPSSPAAVREAYEKLLPSKMLFSIKDQEKTQPLPKHEHILGLFAANQRPAQKVHQFPDHASAMKAIEAGHVSLQDEIEIPDPV